MSEDQNESGGNALTEVAEAVSALTTGIPPELQRSFFKVISRVFIAGAEIPAKWLEGKSRIIEAKSDAQVAEIKSRQDIKHLMLSESAKFASEKFRDPELAERALNYHAYDIIKEQKIREDIVILAAEELKKSPNSEGGSSEVDDDWISMFLKDAPTRSKEEYKILFSKILAGEIRNPGTFSISTIQSISKMTSEVASIFQAACDISSDIGNYARILTADLGGAGVNSLSAFGLSYDNLNKLIEYGLIRIDLNEGFDIKRKSLGNKFNLIDHSSEKFALFNEKHREDSIDGGEEVNLSMRGPGFTQIGLEFRSIVDAKLNQNYLNTLKKWLNSNGVALYKSVSAENGSMEFHVI